MSQAFLYFAATGTETAANGPMQQFGVEWSFLLAQIISFLLVLFVLYKFAFKPVLATVDERQRRIREGLDYAEEMKAKLDAAEKQHAETLKEASLEAQRIIAEARASAKQIMDDQTKETAEKTAQMLEKAQQSIEVERRKMVADVQDEIARLVILTTTKVLSKELSSDERSRFAEAASRELTSV